MSGLCAADAVRANVSTMNVTTRRLRLGPHVLALLVAGGIPAAALAAPPPNFTVEYAPRPYTLAATCDLARPLVFVNLIASNEGNAPTGPIRLVAQDASRAIEGDTTLPQLPAKAKSVFASLSLHRIASSTAPVGGVHRITVTAIAGGGGVMTRLTPLDVTVAPSFCASAPATSPPATAATKPPAGAPPAAATTIRPREVPAMATRTPIPQIGTNRSKVANVVALVRPAAPVNLHNTGSYTDCGAHVGPIGSLVCPDMIKSGDLLLIWDWRTDGGPADVDGYRVYRVDGGLKQLVYTRANKKDLTLVDVAKPAGGYAGKCYAVTAYLANAESELSQPFCANGGSVAKTVRLRAVHARSSQKVHDEAGNTFTGVGSAAGRGLPPARTDLMVGYAYVGVEHTLGDTKSNNLYRAAVAFDVSALANRRIVSAKLHLTIADSKGAGNNHSCITTVGTGTEFWWLNTSWLEGQFGLDIAPTDTGPEITADVTQLVAPWLRGEPNYGFVLINRDEKIATYDNKQCQTSYTSPMLEITYY
jgi:hypothetical protein